MRWILLYAKLLKDAMRKNRANWKDALASSFLPPSFSSFLLQLASLSLAWLTPPQCYLEEEKEEL